jgi:hypothetical protein
MRDDALVHPAAPRTAGRAARAIFDGSRNERFFVCGLAVALVLLRSIVPTLYEGFFFDSDQAIVGLMARHAAAFQRFPLFYYGLNYLLAVEAWIITPFFWIARSSVAIMRVPFVILNAGVAVWLVIGLASRLSLRPALAFVAALPFVMPTPAVGAHLLELAGSCVEPFVYVLLLWKLRERPLWFGALLAFAYLHREFTVFAVPALILAQAGCRAWSFRPFVRHASRIALGFAAVWLVVDDVRMHLSGETLALQAASLGNQVCLAPAELGSRIQALVTEAIPAQYGAIRVPINQFKLNTPVEAGSLAVGVALAATLLVAAARLLAGTRARDRNDETRFGVYLAWIGAFTALAYPLSCNIALHAPPLLRYLLLTLLLPVGLCATFLRRESSRPLRAAVISVFVFWGAVNLLDTVVLVARSVSRPPTSEHRVLADYLVGQRIRYARAIYWDAYVVDFLSRERVIVSAVDVVRIPEYQRAVDEHDAAAVSLWRLPCEGRVRVASWCITP